MDDLKKVNAVLINSHLEELTELSERLAPISEVSEDITIEEFELYFLPFIIGELEFNDENKTIFFYNYKKIAKGVTTPLYVIEDDEVKYKLPPMLVTNDLDGLDEFNFHRILNVFSNTKDTNPMVADKFLASSLNTISDEINTSKKYDLYINELRRIYADYSYRLKVDVKDEKSTQTVKDEEIEEDFIEYY